MRTFVSTLPPCVLRRAPLAVRHGHIMRWLWMALPEDAQQEVALTYVQYPHLTDAAREQLIRYRLRVLRYEVWNREIGSRPKAEPNLRPSKLARRRGYRRNKRNLK